MKLLQINTLKTGNLLLGTLSNSEDPEEVPHPIYQLIGFSTIIQKGWVVS